MKNSNILLSALVLVVFLFVGIDLFSIQAKINKDKVANEIINNNAPHPFDDIIEVVATGEATINIVQGDSNSIKYLSEEPTTTNYAVSNGVLTISGNKTERIRITVKALGKLSASGHAIVTVDSIVTPEFSIFGNENAQISLNSLKLDKLTITATDSAWINQDVRNDLTPRKTGIVPNHNLISMHVDSIDLHLSKAANAELRRSECKHLGGEMTGSGFFNINSSRTISLKGGPTGFSAFGPLDMSKDLSR